MQALVATSEGTRGIKGRDVTGLDVDGSGQVWAIADAKAIWRRSAEGEWSPVAEWEGPNLTCLSAGGPQLLVGTVGAHVLHLIDDQLVGDEAFDELPERKTWYTPWGAPPDTRSVASAGDLGLVNIHVGGVARQEGGGRWQALVDIDVDVHQIVVAPDGSFLVATGAAGFGRSADGGQTWHWDHDGLHGSYCRAVAVSGDQVLLSASTGPFRTQGAIYRRTLGAEGPWRRVSDLVSGNIDSFWLAAADDEAAWVSEDGELWQSEDTGATWERAGQVAGYPRAVVMTN
jgi:hypothetical protein